MLNVEVMGERGASLIDDKNVSLNAVWPVAVSQELFSQYACSINKSYSCAICYAII